MFPRETRPGGLPRSDGTFHWHIEETHQKLGHCAQSPMSRLVPTFNRLLRASSRPDPDTTRDATVSRNRGAMPRATHSPTYKRPADQAAGARRSATARGDKTRAPPWALSLGHQSLPGERGKEGPGFRLPLPQNAAPARSPGNSGPPVWRTRFPRCRPTWVGLWQEATIGAGPVL